MNWSRSSVLTLLRERGIRPRRSLGQSFLVDPNFLRTIPRDAEVRRSDGVIEVGSGLGNLTDALADRANRVWAFETDPRLHALSVELVGSRRNVTFVQADGADFARHVKPGRRPIKVVSNLPYSEWRRLLVALLGAPFPVESYTVMVQRDVYDRLRARPGGKEYGPDSVLVQSTCRMRLLRKAGRRLFHPEPRVESALLRLERRKTADFAALDAALRRMFAQRRKKFGRWLKAQGVQDLGKSRLAEKRVEEIAPEVLARLAQDAARPR